MEGGLGMIGLEGIVHYGKLSLCVLIQTKKIGLCKDVRYRSTSRSGEGDLGMNDRIREHSTFGIIERSTVRSDQESFLFISRTKPIRLSAGRIRNDWIRYCSTFRCEEALSSVILTVNTLGNQCPAS